MAAPKRRKRYSPVEIDSALQVLAYFGGNTSRTSQETGIEDSLLRKWRLYAHRDRYQAIVAEHGSALEDMAVTHSREIMLRAGHVEHRILDELDQDDLTPKERAELAGAFQRVTTAKGINVDKMLTLTDRPIGIVEHRDPKQEAQSLARRLGVALEATAVEIPPALNPGYSAAPLITERHDSNAREVASAAQSQSQPSD